MIDFELTDKQKQWQKKAKDFAEKEIKPLAWRIDRGLAGDYLDPFLKMMAEEGFLALGVPEEYGGAGLDKLTTMIVLEELAVADIGIAFMIGEHRSEDARAAPGRAAGRGGGGLQ